MSAALPAIVFAVLAAFGLSALLTRGDGPKREAARRAARLVRLAVTGTLAAGSAFLFYERYWIWRECFNELGRCYDGEAGVMLEQAGWHLGRSLPDLRHPRALESGRSEAPPPALTKSLEIGLNLTRAYARGGEISRRMT